MSNDTVYNVCIYELYEYIINLVMSSHLTYIVYQLYILLFVGYISLYIIIELTDNHVEYMYRYYCMDSLTQYSNVII